MEVVALYEGLCVLISKEKQQQNIGFPTFKLPASTNQLS